MLRLNGHFDSFGDMIILGTVTLVLMFFHEFMFAVFDQIPRYVIINLVQLHSPSVLFRFLSIITGLPTLK